MPVVTFDLADGSRQRMIIDTGADSVIMTSSLATVGHLTTRPSDISATDATGTAHGVPIALVTSLQLGGATFEDFDAITSPQLFAGVDALLGYPLWRDVLLTIDYSNRVIIIGRGALPPPDGKTVLPLRFDDRNRLTLPVTINGRETWLNLDTGWGVGGILELTAAHAAQVTWASAPKPTIATNAASGAIAEKIGRLGGDVKVGRYRFTEPIAGTNTGLGADILAAAGIANFTLTLDLRNMRVRLDRADADPIRSGPVYVSGFDCDLRGAPMRVLNVLPDSGADRAGLRAGDLLLKIDGRPARDGLFAHNGGDFVVELSRDGLPMKLAFPMTTLVP